MKRGSPGQAGRLLGLVCMTAAASFGADTPDFHSHIAPIFREHCLDCHSANDPDGKLVLESYDTLMQGGGSGPALLPGRPADSLLVKFLEGRSGKEGKNQFMPPGKRAKLKPDQIALIRAWIGTGAPAPQDASPSLASIVIPDIKPKGDLQKPVKALAYSPAIGLLAVGRYGEVELFDSGTRTPVRKLDGVRGGVTALAFSADGAHLFAAAGYPGLTGEVRQWKTADGSLVRVFEGHRDALYALALSPDGKVLATGSYDQRIKLWDTGTGAELRELKGHNGAVYGLDFRPDGKVLASASADRTVKLWQVATGNRLDTFSQPLKEVQTLAFSRDGKHLVAGGADNRLRLWRVSDRAVEGSNQLLLSRFAHEGAILKVAFSPDGKTLVSSAADRTVKIWNAADWVERTLLEKQPDWVPALALTTDHRLVVGRLDGSLEFYNAQTGSRAPKHAAVPSSDVDALTALTSPSPRPFPSSMNRSADACSPLIGVPAAAASLGPPRPDSGAWWQLDARGGRDGRAPHSGSSRAIEGRWLPATAVNTSPKPAADFSLSMNRPLHGVPALAGGAPGRLKPGLHAQTAGFMAPMHFKMNWRLPMNLPQIPVPTDGIAHPRNPESEGEFVRFMGPKREPVRGDFSPGERAGVRGNGATESQRRIQLPTTQSSPTHPVLRPPIVFAQTAKGKPKSAPAKAEIKNPAPPRPALARLEPPGVQRGVASEVKLIGKHLATATDVKVSPPQVRAEIIQADLDQPDELTVRFTVGAETPPRTVEVSVLTPGGESGRLRLHVDDLPQIAAAGGPPQRLERLPAGVWGALTRAGQRDEFIVAARAGQTLVFDLAVKSVGSKMATPALHLFDPQGRQVASHRGFDTDGEPLIAHTAGQDAEYTVRVSDVTLGASPEHTYRLRVGELPFVTGIFPLGVPAHSEVEVRLIGHNLPGATRRVRTGAPGELALPLEDLRQPTRRPFKLIVGALPESVESEPNDAAAQANPIPAPGSVNGRLWSAGPDRPADTDLFAFESKAGERWIIETLAARAGSPADTRIEVLHADGRPVQRLWLQAVRDSWNAFRSVDANNPDIRLGNWEEMELNEYVYFQGDVMKIFRMPRGPDSGFLFYAANGKRRAYFDTSATAHASDEPAYTVVPHPPGTRLVPNGLPVFTLYYANDDDGERELGTDSRLTFTAPAAGRYLVRVTDTRGWQSERHVYRLTLRHPRPDFRVTLEPKDPTVGVGGSVGFTVKADRMDGFEDEITVEITGMPAGYHASSPLVIQAGHLEADGSLHARPDAQPLDPAAWDQVTVTASARIDGKPVSRAVNPFGHVKLGPRPKLLLSLSPEADGKPVGDPEPAPEKPLEITLAPGQTVPAWLRVVRNGETNLVNLDIDNLPHGVIIDNIGLNGVLIRAGENERQIFLAAARWVPEQDRLCHAVISSARSAAGSAGLATSFPVRLKVRKPPGMPSVSAR